MAEPKLTKKAIIARFRAEMGRCSAMTESANECGNWGIERVNDRAFCGQHLTSVLLQADRERRIAERKAKVDAAITRSLAWTALHPSVWDRMPADWGPTSG